MERDLLARIDANRPCVKSRKSKAGFTSVVAVIILLGLVAVMGSVALIWGNNFNFEKQKLSDYYTTNANKIKERIIIEDVWLSTNPANIGVVAIRNVGDIGINIREVKINVLGSNGAAACTTTCESGTSASNAVKAPFAPDSTSGLIDSGQTLTVAVDDIDWNHANSKTLEVFVTTDRGSIIWRVYDWKTQLPQVYTCNSRPVTILGDQIIGFPNDDLVGTDGDDVIAGLTGTDTINGKGGNDTICGGAGNDPSLKGGSGDDIIFGEDGNDQIYGEDGNDTLYGGNDNDSIQGGNNDDYLDGGTGSSDVVRGDDDYDTCVNYDTQFTCEVLL